MVNEIESRLEIEVAKVDTIREALAARTELSGIALRPGKRKVHTDAYFDNAEQSLYRRGWSLRIRESGNDLRLTLKGPSTRTSGGVAERREIENPRDGSLPVVLGVIVGTMVSEGLLDAPPEDIDRHLFRDGAAAALATTGMRRLFDVQTDRETWLAVRGTEPIAEIALDKSMYKTAHGDSIAEARMEIELTDNDRTLELLQLTRALESEFGGRAVSESKFERGVIHARSQGLQEKMEAKVTLASIEQYDEVAHSIDSTDDLIGGYRFNRVDDSITLTDRYYDTPKHALFERGWYLRHRRQGTANKLTFRRLTKEARQGQVLQNEIVVDWTGSDPEAAWRAMWPWLQEVVAYHANPPALAVPDSLDELLLAAGFIPALDIEVTRTSWVVEKVTAGSSSPLRPIGDRVAKLKYDRVRYADPARRRQSVQVREFEVTGVEQHDESPTILLRESYQSFLALFTEMCVHLTGEGVEQKTNAKYFAGLLAVGLVRSAPKWLTDGRLALRVSALRESDTDTPPGPAGWSTARFWIALATMVAALFALSSGSDELADGYRNILHFSALVQLAGLIGLLFASYYLFRKPYGTYSLRLRTTIVLGTLLLACAIILPWAGRSRFADVVSLLGLLPLLVTMLRDGLGFTSQGGAK